MRAQANYCTVRDKFVVRDSEPEVAVMVIDVVAAGGVLGPTACLEDPQPLRPSMLVPNASTMATVNPVWSFLRRHVGTRKASPSGSRAALMTRVT